MDLSDALVFFLFGTVFGAAAFALIICRRYEIRAYWRGLEDGARNQTQNDEHYHKIRGWKLCRLTRCGNHGNLKRWIPIK